MIEGVFKEGFVTTSVDKLKAQVAQKNDMQALLYEELVKRVNGLEKKVGEMDILVNGDRVDALSVIVHRTNAEARGRKLLVRLKDAGSDKTTLDVATRHVLKHKDPAIKDPIEIEDRSVVAAVGQSTVPQ